MTVHGLNLWRASKTVEATAYKSKAFPNFYYLSAVQEAIDSLNITEAWYQVKELSLENDLKSLLNRSEVKGRNFNKNSVLKNYLLKSADASLPRNILLFIIHFFSSFLFKIIWPRWARPAQDNPNKKNIH